jgi:hypothetical protein
MTTLEHEAWVTQAGLQKRYKRDQERMIACCTLGRRFNGSTRGKYPFTSNQASWRIFL